ncbi:cyclophilin-like fold protein [Thiofilum flexile]|uniref:cyclophilin-like fold protein n=1 Tax=Thiofilum flexile TaxID=125627 RepID=UPI000375A4C2|nr:cyclophilin-like fold protein [Thiofilum flexile]
MLYGADCLVIFYKDFPTSYTYTRLARIENPAELVAALGKTDVTITFQLSNEL